MLEEVTQNLDELKELDITHDDLGTANGWHDAQATKELAEKHASKIVGLVNEYGGVIQHGFLNENLTKLNQQITQLKSRAVSVVALVEKGTNQTNYPQQRTSVV